MAVERISSRPDICGGVARIKGTRITIWGLEEARRLGASDDELLEDMPSLTSADLTAAWGYVAVNKGEIDRLIELNGDPLAKPNQEQAACLERIRARKANMRYTDGSRTQEFIDEARNGAMYGETE